MTNRLPLPKVVYLMHNPDAVQCTHKIGIANDAEKRLVDLRVYAPHATLMGLREGGHAEERRLHALLHSYAVGGEWFDLRDYDVASLGFESIDEFYAKRTHLVRGAGIDNQKMKSRETNLRKYHEHRKHQDGHGERKHQYDVARNADPGVRAQRAQQYAAHRSDPAWVAQKRFQDRQYYEANKDRWKEYSSRPEVKERIRSYELKRASDPVRKAKRAAQAKERRERNQAIARVASAYAYAMAGVEQ